MAFALSCLEGMHSRFHHVLASRVVPFRLFVALVPLMRYINGVVLFVAIGFSEFLQCLVGPEGMRS